MKFILFLCLFFISFNFFSQEIDQNTANLLAKNPEVLQRINEINSQSISDQPKGSDKSIDSETNSFNLSEKSKKFGFDYIKSIPTSISSTSDLPVPNNYRISLGDKLRIIITGGKRDSFDLTVGMDGSILFPELGLINVFGETIAEVRKKIEVLVDNSYVGTDVSISLLELSAKKVNIVGAVKNPGTYIVNPFSTISSVLAYSGGFEEYASLRTITILRDGKEIIFDLYQLLINGSRENDLNIEQGDTILVNSTNNFVEIMGSVNRPFIYEYKYDETLKDLISYAMGFSQKANKRNIAVTYLDNELDLTKLVEVNFEKNVNISQFNTLLALEVFSIESSRFSKVRVTGPLENQGYFNVPESGKLSELMPGLEFSASINSFIGVVQFETFSRLFSINDPDTHNINLKDNYEVLFFSKLDQVLNDKRLTPNSKKLVNDFSLRVFDGNQRNFAFFGTANALDVINFFGIDVDDILSDKTTYISPLNDQVITDSYDKLSFTSQKFNSLSFRRLNSEVINVFVAGEVETPGPYTLDSNATLNDLYTLTGGLTKAADNDIAIFERESVRQKNLENSRRANAEINEILINLASEGVELSPNINQILSNDSEITLPGRIAGDFSSKNVERNSQFFLQDGDSLFIPKKLSTFSVIGAVYNSSTYIYDNEIDLIEAIKISGGYKQNALKKNIFVIRSDGFIERPRGLFRKNMKIYPGDTIVVPRDLEMKSEFLDDLIPLTSLLSNLAFSAAAIDNLKQ